MNLIQSSLKLPCGAEIKNRIGKSAMTERIADSNNFVNQDSIINFAEKGGVDRVGILSAGRSYQVGDTVVFDDTVTSSFKASAKV